MKKAGIELTNDEIEALEETEEYCVKNDLQVWCHITITANKYRVFDVYRIDLFLYWATRIISDSQRQNLRLGNQDR